MNIQLVSFNLRTLARQDGENYFPFRMPLIVEKIQAERPDVIGVQECMPAMHDALAAMLPEYGFAGVGRGKQLDDEGNYVLYRKERFILCATDTFWLSPTPHLPGSRYPIQSDNPRICTWAKLWCKANQRFFFFLNTHLDHISPAARQAGLHQVLTLAQELKARQDIPLFVTGDFNFEPDQEPETYAMIAAARLQDLTTNLSPTFHGFMKAQPQKIDYILSDLPPSRFAPAVQWHECRDGVYLSDHDPIAVEWHWD